MPSGTLQEERRSKCKLIIIINSFYTPAELRRNKWEKYIREKWVKYIYHSLTSLVGFVGIFPFIDIFIKCILC